MFLCKNIKVSCRTIAGIAYILDEQTRELHKLDQIGSIIWDLINGECTVDDVAIAVSNKFEGDSVVIRDSVKRFINKLADKELVLLSEEKFEGVYISAC